MSGRSVHEKIAATETAAVPFHRVDDTFYLFSSSYVTERYHIVTHERRDDIVSSARAWTRVCVFPISRIPFGSYPGRRKTRRKIFLF